MLRNAHIQLARSLINATRSLATKKATNKNQLNKYLAAETTHIKKSPNNELNTEETLNAHFLASNFGSNYRTWATALEKHPELKTLKRKDIKNSVESLKSLQYNIDDILTKPMIVYYNSLTLINRHNVLLECGFENITISTLAKYVTVLNKPVSYLKSHGFIPYATDVTERLKDCFTDVKVQLPKDAENSNFEEMPLKALRQLILNEYLRQRLDMNDTELNKMWKVYGRIRHKSFRSVQQMIDIIIKEFKFSKERIKKNIYLAYGEADNIKRILHEIPKIDAQDIREIGYKRPKILMSSCDALKKTLQHVREFGIGEDAVLRCIEVLTLGPDTVLERLREIHDIEEFQVLGTNPRVLRLVHYQNKARLRLDYLNQLKVRCASLHILSCGSEAFAKFARDGSDRTKGRDIIVYLGNVLEKDEHELRSLLSRHPNWCHIPVLQVKQCLEYLLSKKFDTEDIFRNIHMLLYPITRIEEKLQLLQTADILDELQIKVNSMHDLSNNDLLTLILYLIESEFHFTGDGIWTEQHTHHVENFNNLLPDFPESLNKVYKYGVKPAEKFNVQQL